MSAVLYGVLIVPILTAIAVLAGATSRSIKIMNLTGSALTSLLLGIIIYAINTTASLKIGILYVDHLSGLFLAVIAVLSFTASLFSASYMEKELITEKNDLKALKRYYFLFNIFCFTMISVLVVENLGLMWVAIEATTLASALLVAFYFSRAAIEAAWKYVMICTVGICLALLGTILLYYAQVSAGIGGDALSWLALKDSGAVLDVRMVKLAFVFIVIGYGTKVGLAPMHTWLPDAHSQAPSPVSGLLSGALLSCALYVIMRNIAIVKASVGFVFVQQVLMALGLFSILIAIPFLLVQHDIKRLFAYSSVEHMGIITFALGIGTPLAVYGALLHIFNHAVAKSALFYMAGVLTQEYRTKQIMRIKGLAAANPVLGGVFALLVLAITGSPPFGIFFSKFLITWAAFAAGYQLAGGILLVLVAAVFAGMLYYGCQILFGQPVATARNVRVGRPALAAMVLSVMIVAITGFYVPECFNNALRLAAAIVIGG
ncbi:NAD(P)H-quinone oxidoreductase subunit 2, chloroplastic [bioreactor metagenome]|uniref:NAD(P)H-quinone oxidoreductase subunit 2, chloroplastic n=1 Tax=bioreactor metagenome TaxID=1076179 RepID=A0A644U8A2_9ZZZZ|nr:hydrogenase 4 subunit F [Negativicutes bacterium]